MRYILWNICLVMLVLYNESSWVGLGDIEIDRGYRMRY